MTYDGYILDERASIEHEHGAQEILDEACAEQGASNESPVLHKLTDLGNAERLVRRYGDRIRYCPPRRAWLAWDGTRWVWDENGVLPRLAKRTVRGIYAEAEHASDPDAFAAWAHKSEDARRIDAMIKLAATEENIPVRAADLDANPMLLTVKNGTIDLETGNLCPHRREDLITKLAPVMYDPDAACEIWDRYLHDATGGDDELAAYLRRVAGYCLTGKNDERAFFFVHGPRGTGKSTFLDAYGTTLGSYSATAAAETWLKQTTTGGNRGDLVRLMGARLVTSTEVEKGCRWDEALLRRVTGGDELVAAAKYEADVSFRPSFKILFAANDAPKIRDDDEALWERMKRVPFPHRPPSFDKAVRVALCDPKVAGPAILAWAVRGCLEWQRDGLGTCAAVVASTKAYRGEMDRFDRFASECLLFEPFDLARVTSADLRRTYETWCEENGIKYPLTAEEMAPRLREHGAEKGKTEGQRGWRRVRLLRAHEENADETRERDTLGQAGTPFPRTLS